MCRELRDIHPALSSRWREELAENPEKAFSGNEKYKFGQDAPRVSQSAFTGARMRACGRVPGGGSAVVGRNQGDCEDGVAVGLRGGSPPVRDGPPPCRPALDLIIGKSFFRGRGILVMLW